MPDETGFTLHPRLGQGTHPVADLALSHVLLMDDTRFPWLLLVPRRAGAGEITDLDHTDRLVLMEEIAAASQALRSLVRCDKINVGALGNNTPQLHVHVVARTVGDAAWPGPVWGVPGATPYGERLATEAARIATALTGPLAAGRR
jgi:diadenosine tetraphosphate (Ap4A) HIT family hydrolase